MGSIKLGIFGLGITGCSVFSSLAKEYDIICYDDLPTNRESFIAKFGSGYIFPLENIQWSELDEIVISPGVNHNHDIFKIAKINNIKITSDIEIFIQRNLDSDFIFITGTNGKSTCSAMTGHILSKLGLDYHVGGNIGLPVLSLSSTRRGYILELSSFQIELLNNIAPSIAVITNITPDHLDRYDDLLQYTKVKEKILTLDSLKIIGINSSISKEIYTNLRNMFGMKIVAISNSNHLENGIYCNDDYLEDNFFDSYRYVLPKLPHLRGAHNKENIAICYAICRALGQSGASIIGTLESFKNLAHRMEYIGKYQNITFYNDSKATNVSSALSSLSALENIIWFAGGKFKENSLDALIPTLKNVKKVYLFGESKVLFANFLDGRKDYVICEDLEQAFGEAIKDFSDSKDDINFLLAPACASFDQFKNFEERGQLFIKLFNNLV